MRICIYNEPCGGGLGGSEVSVAVLAEALSKRHEVEIVHYRPTITRPELEEFANVDLSRVKLRLGPALIPQKGAPTKVVGRLLAEQRQERELSAGCDLFIAFVHEVPLFVGAQRGVLVVLFPIFDPNAVLRSGAVGVLQRVWYRWKHAQRLRDYEIKLANSEFTRAWTKRRWKVDSAVWYPPIELPEQRSCAKRNLILSVGRFAVGSLSKNQLEMLSAFEELRRAGASGWDYTSAGACGSSPSETDLLMRAQKLAARSGATVTANLPRHEVEELYHEAKIFWHATGLQIDDEQQPERAEHFGMTTVEAMAAGCVPIVINKGGQREIVQHGVTGFLWNTVEELKEYTLRLMADPGLLAQMSAAARMRAQDFSRGAFVRRFGELIGEPLATSPDSGAPTSTAIAA